MSYVIVFDTLCTGFEPVKDEHDQPVVYATEAEAQAEIDSDPEFYDECFVTEIDEIGHKSIWRPAQ